MFYLPGNCRHTFALSLVIAKSRDLSISFAADSALKARDNIAAFRLLYRILAAVAGYLNSSPLSLETAIVFVCAGKTVAPISHIPPLQEV
jgi:hypothetical protein